MKAALLSTVVVALATAQPSPADVAQRAIGNYVKFPFTHDFWSYSYGATIMAAAAYKSVKQFGQSWDTTLDARLNGFLTNSTSMAGKILANFTIPWEGAVGDGVGLYPIAFLAQLDLHGLGKDSPQWVVAERTAERYIINWPIRLADGTFARHSGYPGGSTSDAVLWDDDGFMGLTLLTRLAAHGAANAAVYANVSANMTVSYESLMSDPATGLFHHAVDYTTGAKSCCFWGRANGWQLMSAIETLQVLPAEHPSFGAVKAAFTAHATAMLGYQEKADGRWHQVLDHPETYLETSVTAMAVHAFATGVMQGWLDRATFDASVRAGWLGVSGQVAANGTVAGICIGTGIYSTVADYAARPTTYEKAAPGLGSVFMAALAYDSYVAMFGQ